ncbi:uncharacterized protein PITG_05425 [Phytophthora infestans T30-4]|uniref:DDE Tnp4 domain-containing protein n=1 Tax=Phytophthora infestans (strain T30-4) TaxID=403677 RepID=D0N2S8_PHYIT|nr:uncharacterized protein PITG_05425 [Phytophthora infestans T30-4]EEY69220.1 conserved hypothetical protein [Phytophthora infestans T30-4]|eukprot:XP_002999074.1 conserved hypothetical protein [Phytophthora infestans T30-4]
MLMATRSDADDFRRRFRMRRNLFELITIALVEDEECSYFVQRSDATGRAGFLPEQKVTCALRMLAYGASADQLDELIRMAESTVLETLKLFCKNIIRLFGPEYLRKPTKDDLKILLAENAERGFPGMIGSLDCMHWTWKNCPTAWQGAFQGKEKCSTVILEAVASKSLWIWHAFYGMPGANNDLNVLERSPLLNDLVNGVAPRISFTVNGATYNQGYYLTDGIYPAWAIFQSSISAPQGNKRRCYAAQQEAARKDVERTFGVLQQRFRILALPCKLWSVDAMNDVMLACIILHNMIVEDEQRITSLNHQYLFEDEWVSPAEVGVPDECPVAMIANAMQVLEDEELHYELKTDLIEHVWQCYGDLG